MQNSPMNQNPRDVLSRACDRLEHAATAYERSGGIGKDRGQRRTAVAELHAARSDVAAAVEAFASREAALSAVTAENDRLREALEPFAEAGRLVDEHRPDAPDGVPFHVMVDEEDNGIITLTWGQLRTAALTSEDRTNG